MKPAEKLMIIENELKKFRSVLGKASDTVLDKDVSKYPIFVAHKQEIALGIPLIDRAKSNTNWSINVSSLEEFVTKQLIFEKKKGHRALFKNQNSAEFLLFDRELLLLFAQQDSLFEFHQIFPGRH